VGEHGPAWALGIRSARPAAGKGPADRELVAAPNKGVDRFPRRRFRGVTGGPRQTFAPRSLPRPATRIGSTGTRVLAVSRSSLNGVDNDERVSDRVIAFVALHKPARRRLRRPAGANAIVAVAPDLDDRRDSDVAIAIARGAPPPEVKAIARGLWRPTLDQRFKAGWSRAARLLRAETSTLPPDRRVAELVR
jgi:hypothetical protein